MIILYQFPGGDGLTSISPPCLKVHLALELTGAEYEMRYLRRPGEVREISRTGRLPVLEIEGERIFDSIAIMDRLERAFPGSGLREEDRDARLLDRLLEHYVNDSLYWPTFYMRWVHPESREEFLSALLKRASWIRRWAVRRLFVPKLVDRAMGQGVGRKPVEAVLADIDRGLAMLAEALRGGPFLQGRDRPARGDLALAALIAQAGYKDTVAVLRRRIEAHPDLVRHAALVFDRCGLARPRWLAA